LDQLRLEPADCAPALDRIPADLRAALELAASRIRRFHELQPLPNWETNELGGRLGQRCLPLNSVGVYVPGGTAPLPSSLLMGVIPAQVAGVKEVYVATPPGKDGRIPDVILAAAALTGLDAIYPLGGAQAIAALAYGSESVTRVDKIVGPGNLFVTLAKQQLFGQVGIDGLYGPTETIVIADETADPACVAADLLAQAEHDILASAILLTTSPDLARQVQSAIGQQLESLSRADIIATSLQNQGGIVLTKTLVEAADLSNGYAPEHLCLAVADPQALSQHVTNAGGIFFGERSFEVLGDYVAGPSHTMPTAGTARFSSPLNVMDFVKISSIIDLDGATAAKLIVAAARIAQAEELTAHASAARFRAEEAAA
ncbi:MAG: histidinol dehydrogenase, partial [Anaerolineales bacterium]|nr:histidinol dehydrogenase [Anaerolineales bacterium]